LKIKALSLLAVSTLGWGVGCHAESLGCLIEPDRVADVGSQVVGVLEQIKVERGDMVTAGQVLARLTAQVERASVSVAQAKSTADAEFKQAVASSALAQRKLERTKDLVKKDFVSDQALDQAEAEARVAEQRVSQAREAQRVSQREYQLSAVQLGQRDVRSPFDGIVIERYRTEGERIEREPLVRVARVDPLRIEAIVPAAQFGLIQAGQAAMVKTDLPNFTALNAKVVLVDRVIDPASNSFRVRMVLPNPDNKIPAGLRCRVEFASAQPSAAATKDAAVPVVPTTPALPPSAVSLRGPVQVPGAKRDLAPVGLSGLKKNITDAADNLPGNRVYLPMTTNNRAAIKSYLVMRQPRLSMSTSMTTPGMSPAAHPVASFGIPRVVVMR
jgi:RND family efflux transporter MFP subunit